MGTQSIAGAEPPSRAATLALVGGALCLDFANTSSGRGTPLRQEHLRRVEHLLAWAVHAGMLDADGQRALAAAARNAPALADETVARALSLREAIYGLFRAAVAGAPPPDASLAIFNAALSEAMAAAALRPDATGGFTWGWSPVANSAAELLWPIAHSALRLLTGRELGRVKLCPGHGCGWLFLDRTRNGRRRWCEMEVCGSRAKMRRYHQRRRLAAAGDGP